MKPSEHLVLGPPSGETRHLVALDVSSTFASTCAPGYRWSWKALRASRPACLGWKKAMRMLRIPPKRHHFLPRDAIFSWKNPTLCHSLQFEHTVERRSDLGTASSNEGRMRPEQVKKVVQDEWHSSRNQLVFVSFCGKNMTESQTSYST